ncbi:MAG TPA: cbb3-type cytochrome oxidase assembly protein CcoS [Anaeromyxobacteraceae bacterium]|nr:cbb3-type cytochrome oxidase assembly protein CcoS [Anaeromyxobacteraceae bacterium]
MSLGLLIAVSLGLGALAWLGFLWAVRSGQFDDPEGPKYRMLEDEDEDEERGELPARAARPGEGGAGPPRGRGQAAGPPDGTAP